MVINGFNFIKFAKSITGKRVRINKDCNKAYQTESTIVINNSHPLYYTFHETCHYIISSSENKKKYNLRYGKDDNHGYGMPDSDERDECTKEERLVGELQKYLIEKYKLAEVLFGNEYTTGTAYLIYIRDYEKPKDEESLIDESLKRMEETNKEFGIDIEQIIVNNIKIKV
jgi:hypothetical protein